MYILPALEHKRQETILWILVKLRVKKTTRKVMATILTHLKTAANKGFTATGCTELLIRAAVLTLIHGYFVIALALGL